MNLTHILKQPVITEKSLNHTGLNRYTFLVAANATKGQIRQAVEEAFEVTVTRVWTQKIPGTTRRTGRRRLPAAVADKKKAIVQLKKNQSIKAFETKG